MAPLRRHVGAERPTMGPSDAVEGTGTDGQLVLGPGARRLRVVHEAIAVGEIACLGCVWVCAITRRRNRWLRASVAILLTEGLGLVVGRGKCPLGPLQQRLGDPVPLFVMWFGPRAARRAVPLLVGVTLVGLLSLVLRPPARQPSAPPSGPSSDP